MKPSNHFHSAAMNSRILSHSVGGNGSCCRMAMYSAFKRFLDFLHGLSLDMKFNIKTPNVKWTHESVYILTTSGV
ncbi:MAG: hypothetical protein V4500_06300 [Pseudomonadota bacterium]